MQHDVPAPATANKYGLSASQPFLGTLFRDYKDEVKRQEEMMSNPKKKRNPIQAVPRLQTR